MMTFDQAFAAAMCGGRIRRDDWDCERFIRFDRRLIDEMGYPYAPRDHDVEYDSWELFQ